MRLLPFAALASASLGCAHPALADAVTYKGTLGKLPIILEITTPPEDGEGPVGRYAYMAKGTDIPLRGLPARPGTIRLQEEAPCIEKTCAVNEEGAVEEPPVGAEWTLTGSGGRLSGAWTDRITGKTLPIRLERRAARAIDTTTYAPLESLRPENSPVTAGNPRTLSPEALPYDFLKLDWPRKAGPETKVGAVVLRSETDERNGVEYPIVIALDGEDTGPINAYLRQGRLQAELPSFSCRSQAYAGFGWAEWHAETAEDDDANVPSVTIDHVSPRLIGLTEGGSFFCGGAHPDNFIDHKLADARTGAPIVPESLLAGFNAVGREGTPVDPAAYDNADASLTYAPSAELLAYVRTKRETFDDSTEAECGVDELIGSNLGVYFTQDDLVFTLVALPHAIFACGDDLLKVPLAEARPLLTEDAAHYFAVLDE